MSFSLLTFLLVIIFSFGTSSILTWADLKRRIWRVYQITSDQTLLTIGELIVKIIKCSSCVCSNKRSKYMCVQNTKYKYKCEIHVCVLPKIKILVPSHLLQFNPVSSLICNKQIFKQINIHRPKPPKKPFNLNLKLEKINFIQ